MRKSELVAHIAQNAGVSRDTAEKVLASVVSGLMQGLRKDGNAPLTGLGTFRMIDRPARMGRNPATGASIQIPAKKVLKFKPSKGVEKQIAGSW